MWLAEIEQQLETNRKGDWGFWAWMNPDSEINLSLKRIERIGCRCQMVQQKESLARKSIVYIRKLVLVPICQFELQLDHSGFDLHQENKKIMKENTLN